MNRTSSIAVALVALLTATCPAAADTLTGSPTITDGDTLRFKGGIRIRLFGVDTPEKNQRCEMKGSCYPCGADASKFARDFVGKKDVTCELTGDKTYDRYVAICRVGGKDLGEALIANGWAVTYREFLKGHRVEAPYISAETLAQSKGVGLHRGRFISPIDWRNHKMRLECER